MKTIKLLVLSLIAFSAISFGDTPPPQLKWGLIQGTLSNQTDLSSALAGKMPYVVPGTSGNVLTSNGSIWASATPTNSAVWGLITGTLGNQTDLATALSGKEPSITAGTSAQYWRGDKTFQTLNTSVVPELTNLYYTQARFDSAFSAKSTTNLIEGSNLYYTQSRFDSAFSAKSTTNLTEGSNLYFTNTRAQGAVSATSPLVDTSGVFSIPVATSSVNGYLSSSDWTTFNNKLSKTSGNYITNPDAEIDISGWNLYNDTGRTVPASGTNQDITYTSALSGGSGNGATISYTFCGSSYIGPVVTCPSGTAVQVCWYNGPTLSQNPTATVLKAAFDAQSCATAIATSSITGTASKLQYINGTTTLNGGGDTSPVDGAGGSVTGVTFTRNTSTPLIGVASFDLGKDAASREGMGVSTDIVINSIDKNSVLQISFVYQSSSGMVLGSSSDAQVFMYDIGNSALIPVTPARTLAGPVSTPKQFVGLFNSTNSSNYRLIVHIATASTAAWDLLLDSVTVNDQINAVTATQVPSLVILSQPISGAVTDRMVVMWRDGASQWVPATIAGAAIPAFGDDFTQLGFATNIVGSIADIYIRGYMGGFSFGPFTGYEQYIDNTAGLISPLPSPFTDTYVAVGMAISSTELNIQFNPHVPLVQTSNVPRKGGVLTNTGANDGTGDVAIAGGTTGQFLRANSGVTAGLQWFTPVGTAPITYTASTSAYSCAVATASVPGCLAAADFTTFNAKAATASPTFTGTPTLPTGTIGVTQTAGNSTTALATTAFVTTADNLKANLASPTFTGTPTLPTGTIGTTQTAGNSTTALATTAFVTTADNLKANIAAPTLTGDVTLSTGNLLISTIGKGPQVKTGTNAKIGTAVLVGGTVTVANTSVTANSRIFLTSNTDGGTPGWLRVSAKTNATSFVITSSNPLDTSTVAWLIVESIP